MFKENKHTYLLIASFTFDSQDCLVIANSLRQVKPSSTESNASISSMFAMAISVAFALASAVTFALWLEMVDEI